jgi:hypothetical protein
MRVSIFGSYRQQPLLTHYTGTSIQEALTYPHYTKEIIQAIEFCKGMPVHHTQHCFRTGILNKRPITNQAELQREYEESDVIVVEIASRISYEWKNLFMHHIASEEQYGFYDRNSIIQHILSDEEIEKDICEIKELVFPKKLLIVSHIYTYYSKRYELVALLDKLCLRYHIAFLSPSEYLNGEKDIYQNESILSHYTDKGHYLIGNIYKHTIQNMYNKKTIVCVFKQSYYNYSQTNCDNFWGIGDMIRSMYGLYKKMKQLGHTLIIDLSHHPLSQFIIGYNHAYSSCIVNKLDTIPFLLENEIQNYIEYECKNTDVIYIGAHFGLHAYDPCNYDTEIKQFIKRHLRPTSKFMSFFNNKINMISLSDAYVMHYRLGDNELVRNKSSTIELYRYYNHLVCNNQSNSILLSDSSSFKTYVKKTNVSIITFDHNIGHLGYDTSYDKLQNTFFEFILLSKVNHIKSYSVYEWASGFVSSIHHLYNIPVESVICFQKYV